MLTMQLPITLCYGACLQQTIVAGLLYALRCGLPKTLAVNAAINHDMRDMYAFGPEFTGECLA